MSRRLTHTLVRWKANQQTLQAILDDAAADTLVRVKAARILTRRASIELAMGS